MLLTYQRKLWQPNLLFEIKRQHLQTGETYLDLKDQVFDTPIDLKMKVLKTKIQVIFNETDALFCLLNQKIDD